MLVCRLLRFGNRASNTTHMVAFRLQRALKLFAFRETDLQVVLEQAARVCAECLDVPFCKICRYRSTENDLLVVAGQGWKDGVVGYAISMADHSSPQGLAFETGEPQLCPNIAQANTYKLPAFYSEHSIVSTADVWSRPRQDLRLAFSRSIVAYRMLLTNTTSTSSLALPTYSPRRWRLPTEHRSSG